MFLHQQCEDLNCEQVYGPESHWLHWILHILSGIHHRILLEDFQVLICLCGKACVSKHRSSIDFWAVQRIPKVINAEQTACFKLPAAPFLIS